jgi:predicted metal-dependent hydrolase
MGLVQESDALYLKYAKAIETLSATDPKVRWRARLLRVSNQIVLDEDGPQVDAALSALQRLADTPEAHVQVARQQERLLARRSEFERAARKLDDAWRRYSGSLDEASKLQLRIDLGYALLNADRNADARRVCEAIDRTALRNQDPALQIRALRLLVRELDARGSDRDALVRTINDWQRTAEQLYGSDSLEAAKAYVWSVGVITDPQEQDVLMRKAYAIQTAKLPPASMALAYAEYNMADFFLELRQRPDLALPHLAQASQIGRGVSSRAHADVRTFELAWAETLNRLGRYRECLDRLSAPPGDPGDEADAKTLSKLRLELAKAAAALHRLRDAREEMAAVEALWQELGNPLPAELSGTMRTLEASLVPRADER